MSDTTPPVDGLARPIWKRVALSYRTPVALGAALLLLHGFLFARCASWLPRGEVVSGFGAVFVVLGLAVAARPFIDEGIRGMARQTVHPPSPGFYGGGVEHIREVDAGYERQVDAAIPVVVAERIIGVGVIVLGTLVNGYGGALARLNSWGLGLGACPA